jgi:hypothetical protein
MQRLSFPVPKRHHSKLLPPHGLLQRPVRQAIQGFAFVLATAFLEPAHSAQCVATSNEHRVALLELYTSQGCNSCPPADRWLGGLQDRGTGTNKVVPLAFHVDYWDYIGWKDRFAQPEFAQRQRLLATRNQLTFIYTPQFVLNGRDFRRPWKKGELEDKLENFNADRANVRIELRQARKGNRVRVTVSTTNSEAARAHLFVALFQNGLHSDIKAGENAGKKLYHEFVVRELQGPLPLVAGKSLEHELEFDLSPYADISSIGLAAFVEHANSGESLQAMAVPVCKGVSTSTATPSSRMAQARD